MRKLKDKLKSKPYLALTVPAVLCFVTFITNLAAALKDGNIDSTEYHQLLSTADGFEAVVIIIVMGILHSKNK